MKKGIKKIVRVLGLDSIYNIEERFIVEFSRDNLKLHFISKENIRGSSLISLCNRVNMNNDVVIEFLYVTGLVVTFTPDNAKELIDYIKKEVLKNE